MCKAITLKDIAVDVTSEQMGRCQRIVNMATGEDFYLVLNSKDEVDDNGDIIEYEVRYSEEYGFTCNCKSGQFGFAGCKNYCWHCRAACVCLIEERTAIAEMTEKVTEKAVSHPLELPVVSIEQKWNIPAWMLNAPVARHMRNAPKEK